MEFEWDRKKAKYNLRKHRVSFEEASSVFDDALAAIYNDPNHSLHDKRFIMIGMSVRRRLLIVSFADRDQRIRIISARMPTKREKKFYEEESK